MYILPLCIFVILIQTNICMHSGIERMIHYEPTWDSLDDRITPDWYDNVKVGIFIHWGVYSVPSFGSEWFWVNWKEGKNKTAYEKYMQNYPPSFAYQDFAKEFRAEFYDPVYWATLFKDSGAKYVVLTSKHHEGFTLWPSPYSFGWNSVDVGPHRDLIASLASAIRDKGLYFGVYYSLYEWNHPIYLADKASGFQTQHFIDTKMLPEIKDLIIKFKPDIVWADGDWDANYTYWRSTEFLAWLYSESPVRHVVVTNDRWGKGIPCHHGDVYTCDDRYNPGVLQRHKWENCMTIDKKSWGYRRNANYSDYITTNELIKTLVETVSCGGNILINVGPTKEGTIAPIYQERLQNLGEWLKVNGEAIYESVPWLIQNDTIGTVWYTSAKNSSAVYAISLEWPYDSVIQLGSAIRLFYTPTTVVELLGEPKLLTWVRANNVINIELPDKSTIDLQWAWTLKITHFERK